MDGVDFEVERGVVETKSSGGGSGRRHVARITPFRAIPVPVQYSKGPPAQGLLLSLAQFGPQLFALRREIRWMRDGWNLGAHAGMRVEYYPDCCHLHNDILPSALLPCAPLAHSASEHEAASRTE